MTKINFSNMQSPPLNDATLNQLQDNIEGAIDATYGELLWENEHPTDDFSAQTINLPSNTYQFYRIGYKYTTASSDILYKDVRVGEDFNLYAIIPYTPGLEQTNVPIYLAIAYRPVCSASSTGVVIGSGYQSTSNSSSKIVGTPSYAIPVKIWGYNLIQS